MCLFGGGGLCVDVAVAVNRKRFFSIRECMCWGPCGYRYFMMDMLNAAEVLFVPECFTRAFGLELMNYRPVNAMLIQ